jgi:hypothetical protein
MSDSGPEYQSASDFISKRLADGVRDPEMLTDELLKPRLRGLLAPLVRDYAENRIRAYVRSIENMAGRDESPTTATGKYQAAPFASPLQARQRLLRESVWVPGGAGFVLYADLTVEMVKSRISYMEDVAKGAMRSIRFLEAVISAIERNGVRTFGEVPAEDPLFQEVPA